MTYAVAKEFIALHLEGDNSSALVTASHFHMAMIDLLTRCEPITHINTYTGTETDVFRRLHSIEIDDVETPQYLRLPTVPTTIGADEMDIDEALSLAIVFFVCSYFSKRQGGKRSYEARAEKIISIYTSNQAYLN